MQTGTEECRAKAIVLSEIVDEEFLDHLVAHVSALNEFGGEVYISAARQKFNEAGQPVDHSEVGAYETFGYVLHYGHRSRLRGQRAEPDVELNEAEPPVAEEAAAE